MKKKEEKLNNIAEVEQQILPTEEQSATDVSETDVAEVVTEEIVTEEGEKVYYKEMTPGQMVARRFFRSRLSLIGLIMVIALFVFAFAGPLIMKMCGYKWGEVDVDSENKHLKLIGDEITLTLEDGTTITAYQYFYTEMDINTYASPSSTHFLGTDEKGMDVFIRLMYGGRVSLLLGFAVVILETLIGVVLGGLAGHFGGWVDQTIMRVVDILNCIPTLPLLLILSAVIDSWNVNPKYQIYYLLIILTLFGWSGIARMVRGQILYLREQEFIVASEVMGIPAWRRIFKHLIPNIMPQLIVSMTLGLGSIILYEATLSYLGLGIPIPYAAWGTMISSATNDPTVMESYPSLWIPAGLLIVIAVLGFNFVGDGLRDAMDPKAKR